MRAQCMRCSREGSEYQVSSLAFMKWNAPRRLLPIQSEVKRAVLCFTDNGPCLGSRKPNQPYEWQSYQQVRCGPGKRESNNLPVLNTRLYNSVFCLRRWRTERSASARLSSTEDTLTRETSSLAFFPRTDQRYDKRTHPPPCTAAARCEVKTCPRSFS